MPRGDKSKYTDRQKRKAEHIEEGYEKRGVSKKESERRAWATVNKEEGGGNKSGSGRSVTRKSLRARADGLADAPRRGVRRRRVPARPRRRPQPASGARAEPGQFVDALRVRLRAMAGWPPPMTIAVLPIPARRTSRYSVAAWAGCNRTQPCDAGPPRREM